MGAILEQPSARRAATKRRPLRVVIVEGSFLIRESLARLLGEDARIEVVAVCADAAALRAAVEQERPEVIVTEIRISPEEGPAGIRLAERLHLTNPEMGVLLLSQYCDPVYAEQLLESGSDRRGYLLKERIRHREELVAAIEAVARGESVFDSKVVEVLMQARGRSANSPLTKLTAREVELLRLIAQGSSNSAIADTLFLTKRAVEKHVNSIFVKLGLPASESEHVSRRVKAALIFLGEQGE